MDSILNLNNITKSFGNFKALDDVSLNVKKGEFLSLLGPSGCGKTTLLRIIAGLEKCQLGEVKFENEDITLLEARKRGFGIVFQSYALFPNMTSFENIAFALNGRGLSKKEIENKCNELLGILELKDNKNKYPRQLSGGQQQRVALGRALATSPKLLLLDEPLSALDAKVREKLRYQLKKIQKTLGITTIMVTHDQEEALSISDRIAVMNNGTIEQIGTPEEIYDNPASDFSANFIGITNIINGSYVRPEAVNLSHKAEESAILVKIQSVEFRGSFYRLSCKCKENSFFVDIPKDEYREKNLDVNLEVWMSLKENFKNRVCIA
ncbi:MAG: ATP-binding cassette domain-containing protein [Clostridium sp.]